MMLDGTPALRLYASHRLRQLRSQDPARTQERQLQSLVHHARETRFGRDHGFADIRSVRHFQDRVPLRTYNDFWTAYWASSFPRLKDCTWPGMIPTFAVSSGTTTGVTKYIPCTDRMVKSNIRAGLDLLVHHVTHRPGSKVLGGANFMLGGSTQLQELTAGIFSGDISGILARRIPWYAKRYHFPPSQVRRITDWEEKIDAVVRHARKADVRTIAGTPSWLLILFDQLAAADPERGRKLAAFFPNLELLVHGGVNFAPYRPVFEELLAESKAEMREVYPASEGFMAVADRGAGDGLRLMLDAGLFYEFVPVEDLGKPDPVRHWIADVQTDVNYAVVLSTCAGLWSYVVGDTVRFVDLRPPRLLITGRTSYTLSPFGEHVIAEEVETAVARAADAISAHVTDYSVGARFPSKEGDLGRHLFVVEFAGRPSPDQIDTFALIIDQTLSDLNEDYRVHRAGGFAMEAPCIQVAPPGTFAAWMKSRGQLGGQHKVPRVINDQDLFSHLRDFVERAQPPPT